MSLLLVEGFDDGLYARRALYSIGNRWNGRTGNGKQFNDGNEVHYITFTATQTVIVGQATLVYSGTNPYVMRLYGDGNSTQHVSVRVLSTGKVQAFRGGSALLGETATGVFSMGIWHYLEAKVTISNTVGVVQLKLDGVSILNLSGQDTRNGGTLESVDTLHYNGSGSGIFAVDDIYICDNSGSLNNDFLGDCRIYTLFPNGNGNYSQLTGSDGNSTDNYLLVDESPTPSSTDYVGDSTAGNKDTYTFDDLTPTVGTILGVATGLYAAKADAGTKHARPVIRRSSTDATGADVTLSTSYDLYDEIFEEDPIASAAWTVSTVNASEFGFEVRN